jgi:anti-anti-sigma factor
MSSALDFPRVQTWTGHGLTITVTTQHTLQAAVCVAGELDLASSSLLGACLENQLDTGRRYTRVDLSGVDFVDVAGLNAILDAHETYLRRRGMLILGALSPKVERLVGLVGAEDDLLIARYRATGFVDQSQHDQGGTGAVLRVVR